MYQTLVNWCYMFVVRCYNYFVYLIRNILSFQISSSRCNPVSLRVVRSSETVVRSVSMDSTSGAIWRTHVPVNQPGDETPVTSQ